MEKMTKWASEKLWYHRWAYGEFYDYSKEFAENDDRRLFINIFDKIKEAIEAVSAIENNTVKVAMNKQIEKDYAILKSIQNTFWEQFKANVA